MGVLQTFGSPLRDVLVSPGSGVRGLKCLQKLKRIEMTELSVTCLLEVGEGTKADFVDECQSVEMTTRLTD